MRYLLIALTLGACDYDDAVDASKVDCDEIERSFVDEVLEPILRQHCIRCHNPSGLANQSDMVLGDDAMADLAIVGDVAKKTIDGESVLLLRPTGRHPSGHTGGALIEVGSEAYQALERFVDAARACALPERVDPPPSGVDCGTLAGPRLLRRLSRDEWATSVHDLLGVDASPAALAPDDVLDGFDNQAEALTVTPLLADQLRGEAERLARLAIDTRLGALVSCDLAANGCSTRFVRELGLRAFRRPLTDDEVATYLGLYSDVAAEDGAKEGAVWVLTALLQSPHFLYRSELGVKQPDGSFALTEWERATALSYLTIGAPPDETLLRHASKGELADPATLQAELARLLADPRADATLARFGERWLGIDRLPVVARDATLYPELTAEVRADMAGEAARFLIAVADGGGTTDDLLTSRTGFMTDRLADYYGLPRPTGEPDAQGFRTIVLDDTHYGGLLRLGAVLTTHALPQSSSPIHRGKMIRERLLCEDLPPPPSNLDTSPPPMDPTKSTRERYAEHSSNQECAGCHTRIDSIGFALEHFDGIGRWRESDGPHAIDDSGTITHLLTDADYVDVDIAGPDALARTLAESGAVARCYATQQLRFGFGYDPPACLVDDLVSAHQGLADFIDGLATSPAFATRHGDASEGDSFAVGAWDFDAPPDTPVDPVDPTDPDPTPIGTVTVDAVESSRWNEGYCMQFTITNVGDAPSGWTVERAVEGTINNLWSAKSEIIAGNRLRFTGLEWNATLAVGANTSFGYCAAL